MKQREDTKTADMLRSAGARAQAAYAERQRAAGRRQVNLWLTDAEANQVRNLLEQLREGNTR